MNKNETNSVNRIVVKRILGIYYEHRDIIVSLSRL